MTPEAIEAGKWYHYHKKLADYYGSINEPVLCDHHRGCQDRFHGEIVAKGWNAALTDQKIMEHIANPSGAAPKTDRGAFGSTRGNE